MRCRWRVDYRAGPVSRTYPADSAAAAPPLVPGPARAGTELCRVLSPPSGSAGQRFIESAREPVQSLDKPARRSVKSSCLSSLAEHSENRMYSRMISCGVVALAVTGAGSAILGVAPAVAQPPLSSGADVPGFPVTEASIADLEAAYVSGRTTARAVTQAYLDRIEAYDKRGPFINSLITVNPRALEEAERLDALLRTTGRPIGPLHGIPVIVKDNIDVARLPMTSGFQGWKNYYPSEDAPLVKKIRAAGGIILAKSSLSEFALGLEDTINSVVPGFVRNPYNTAFASGGSSGGTGASVAANFGVVGLGSDTGGSVRVPSAFNALAGLRPTVGLVSRTGLVPFDSAWDTPGPMARTVTDMAILLDVIVGADAEDAATSRAAGHIAPSYASALKTDVLKGARLGVLRQIFKSAVTDPRVIAHFETTLAELKAAGAEIVDPLVVPEI